MKWLWLKLLVFAGQKAGYRYVALYKPQDESDNVSVVHLAQSEADLTASFRLFMEENDET